MSYILVESPVSESSKIQVKKSTPTKVFFTAVLQSLGVRNINRRIYPEKDMKESISYILPTLKDKTFGGELDHPVIGSGSETDWIRHTQYQLKEASHAILSIRYEGNLIIGEMETLSTPNGRTLAGLIGDGVKVGFSVRAISDNIESTSEADIVHSPITIISWDAVSFPSHREAYIQEIKSMESVQIPECKDSVCMITEHLKRFGKHKLSETAKCSCTNSGLFTSIGNLKIL